MTSLIYNFTGTHGSGKTTLANIMSKNMEKKLFLSSASQIHKDFGVNANQDIDFGTRLDIQEEILNRWSEQYREAELIGGGVFDRTPLDFVAYLMAECPRELPEEYSLRAASYVQSCMSMVSEMEYIIFVHPHGNRMNDRGTGKPSTDNIAYQMLIHTLISGFIANFNLKPVVVGRGDVKQRLNYISIQLSKLFEMRSNEIMQEKANLR